MKRGLHGVTVIDHPVAQSELARLRDRSTSSADFRLGMRRISLVIATEVTRALALARLRITTPLETTMGARLRHRVALIPILRAGLGMVDAFLEVLPEATVGHIGIFRDENTLQPVDYYVNVPRSFTNTVTIVLDPMLATGGSACAAIRCLRERGAKSILLAGIVAAPQGLRAVRKAHPGVKLFTCAVDRALNASGYILPGLGDAGDRLFGTD